MTLLNELKNGKKKTGRPTLKYANPLTPHPLKMFFADLGITQTVISNKLKIHKSLLSRYLNGSLAIPIEHENRLRELADKLKTEMG